MGFYESRTQRPVVFLEVEPTSLALVAMGLLCPRGKLLVSLDSLVFSKGAEVLFTETLLIIFSVCLFEQSRFVGDKS